MEITLQLKPNVARALTNREPLTEDSDELLKTAAELHLSLVPLHPGVEDPQLTTYFTAEVADHAQVQEVISRLRQCHAVEAAYVKPQDAMP
jgi:hypothetical protein